MLKKILPLAALAAALPMTAHAHPHVFADARLEVEALEAITGPLLDDDERDEIDTLGGLVCALAGRVPGRGEVVRHRGGLQFEILEGDPRRVTLLKLRGLPRAKTSSSKPD